MDKEYIKDVPVSKLKPYERNPRKNKHAVEVLAKSIQRVGNNDPIEVNEDYVILCGHTRKQALEKLNIKTTDIIMIKGLTEEQQNEYRITNNKTGEIAEWDFEVLEEDFSVEELVEFGFEQYKEKFDNLPDDKIAKDYFIINISFQNEKELQKHFDKLTNEGYICKIIM